MEHDFSCPVCGCIQCDYLVIIDGEDVTLASPPTCQDCNVRMIPVNSTLKLLLDICRH